MILQPFLLLETSAFSKAVPLAISRVRHCQSCTRVFLLVSPPVMVSKIVRNILSIIHSLTFCGVFWSFKITLRNSWPKPKWKNVSTNENLTTKFVASVYWKCWSVHNSQMSKISINQSMCRYLARENHVLSKLKSCSFIVTPFRRGLDYNFSDISILFYFRCRFHNVKKRLATNRFC